jgi:hypothetical protein
MEEDFENMNMGYNIQLFEKKLRELLNKFKVATKCKVETIGIYSSYNDKPDDIVINIGKVD